MSQLRPLHPLDPAGEANTRAESVTEFTRRVKALLESQLRAGWVRGEVSNLRIQASGHVYFSLKDSGAQLSAVMFRGDAMRQPVALRDGMQVVVFGQISVYEARGQYQLIVRLVVEDGVGRLQREFDALKRKLADEGLFAAERKKSIPAIPRVAGFITSPTGAAVQDFCRILARRGWRGRLIILPSKVQGDGAAADMIAMLEEAARMEIFDLLIIGRGGGSIEDLWAFNEEALVRAVAACPIPIVSAVGHEIDFTLCDFAADLRAETPSGAAELISSGFVREQERCTRLAEALRRHVVDELGDAAQRMEHARARLRLLAPSSQIERGFLQLDDLRNRLQTSLGKTVQECRQRFTEMRSAFRERSPETRVQIESHRLLGLWKRLQAASPESVLNRGFVILRDEATSKPLQRREELEQLGIGTRLIAQFADGESPLTTTLSSPKAPKKKA